MGRPTTTAASGFRAAIDPESMVTDPTGSYLVDPKTGIHRATGHGRPLGSRSQVTAEARNFSLTILRSADYRKSLLDRVKSGTLPPNIEAMLWAYAYGRPMERVEVTHVNPTAQLADLSIEQLAARAETIAGVLKQVGDIEAAEKALALMNEADEQRRLTAVDATILDPSKDPPADVASLPDTEHDPARTAAGLKLDDDSQDAYEAALRQDLAAELVKQAKLAETAA